MKGKYRPKPIKRHDHTGAMVNYGTLEVGIVAGIRCLASKQTLILIGAGLTKQKVPDYFYTHHYVRVPVSHQLALKVYVIKATDASSLAGRISARIQLKKAELINTVTNGMEEIWHNGSKVVDKAPHLPTVKMEDLQLKCKAKKVGKLYKLYLLIKRLFSN